MKIRILKAKTNETFYKYKPNKDKITLENIISFYEDYTDNRISNYYKSEPIPEVDEGLLKVNFTCVPLFIKKLVNLIESR